jgi:hypothetical protein
VIIPPPSKIDHTTLLFSEDQVYDMNNLRKYVCFEFDDMAAPVGCARPQTMQEALEKRGDIFLSASSSRIRHFQCIGVSASLKLRADRIVFYGLTVSLPLREKSVRTRKLFNLEADYDAVHLRRGDFDQFAKDTQLPGASIAMRVKEMCRTPRPLFVATDGDSNFISDLRQHLFDRRLVMANDVRSNDSDIIQAVLEQLMCAQAVIFIGTRASTFTTGIFQMRQQESARNPTIEVAPQLINGSEVPIATSGAVGEQCWERATVFRL